MIYKCKNNNNTRKRTQSYVLEGKVLHARHEYILSLLCKKKTVSISYYEMRRCLGMKILIIVSIR
jgi:hypothetical protein